MMTNEIVPPLNIMITAKEEPDDEPYTQIWDVRAKVRSFLLGFGNGVWDEIRIVGESQEALNAFRMILSRGGYSISDQPATGVTLFHEGDECWAGFVFIDPIPKPLSE